MKIPFLLILAVLITSPDAHAMGKSRFYPKDTKWSLQLYGKCINGFFFFPETGPEAKFVAELPTNPPRKIEEDDAGFKFDVSGDGSVRITGKTDEQKHLLIGSVSLSPSLCEGQPDADGVETPFEPNQDFKVDDRSYDQTIHRLAILMEQFGVPHPGIQRELKIHRERRVYGMTDAGHKDSVTIQSEMIREE